jgi:hypothetical protein
MQILLDLFLMASSEFEELLRNSGYTMDRSNDNRYELTFHWDVMEPLERRRRNPTGLCECEEYELDAVSRIYLLPIVSLGYVQGGWGAYMGLYSDLPTALMESTSVLEGIVRAS